MPDVYGYMNLFQFSLNTRIVVFAFIIAIVPVAAIFWRLEVNNGKARDIAATTFQSYSSNLIDLVERNLFERYGDVQAFASNEALLDRSNWYQKDENQNGIIRAANKYTDLYDIYAAMIIVDLEGKPIAVNTRDADGNSINTDWLFGQNFASETWFENAKNGRFLTGSGTDGTYVEDANFDEIVERVYGGNGLALSYSAPVYDADGKVIAVWHNKVSFDIINSIYEDYYTKLKAAGYSTVELTLLNDKGEILVDLDPTLNNQVNEVNSDPNVILNLNLATNGVEAARSVIQGISGSNMSMHFRKQLIQVAGYSHSVGALGYKGLGWSTLVRVDKKEAIGFLDTARNEVLFIILLSVFGALLGAWKLAKSISKPLMKISDHLTETSMNALQASQVVDNSSEDVANGASKQAASVEETSASLEELTSSTAQNRESVGVGEKHVQEANKIVYQMNGKMENLTVSMSQVAEASQETQKIVKTIDEIAFQTNILALNAAVEAARAGEAGAGFAVVADEVRSLAGRAAEAARNTAQMIGSNVEMIEASSLNVAETEEGFKSLQSVTQEVEEVVKKISIASEEQNCGITQINSAVGDISAVTQANASTAEEVTAAAKDLNMQAKQMKEYSTELNVLIHGDNKQSSRLIASSKSNEVVGNQFETNRSSSEEILWN